MRVALILLALLAARPATGQMVQVSGVAVELQIPILGAGYGTAVDTSTRLTWQGRQGDRHKITVQSLVVGQTYDLSVTAVGARRGQAAGTVALTAGMSPQDIVTNLPPGRWNANKIGEATLRYEASVPAGTVPSGEDVHRVIYTVTVQ